jgi:uncharacterized protein (TIGR01777 family)
MAAEQKVVLAGATGMIGRAVARLCIEQGYAVTVFSRDPDAARETVPGAAEYVRWLVEPARLEMPWVRAVDGTDAVINCAGEDLFARRLTARYEEQAQFTRVHGTLALVQAMSLAKRRPSVFINSSSQGIYGFSRRITDAPVTEDAPPGRDTWAKGNRDWEAEALAAGTMDIRVVLMRTGYVLGPAAQGGLARQIAQYRRGWGAITTPTEAWVSWIHVEDEARLYLLALEDSRVTGPLNCTAPRPVTKREYARLLGLAALGRPVTRVVPGLLSRLMMGKAAGMVNYGRRVVPAKAQALDFQFGFPTLASTLADLVPRIDANAGSRQPAPG